MDIESKECDINEYVLRLLGDKQFQNSEYHNFLGNCYSIASAYGILSAGTLFAVLKRAKWSHKLRVMLPDILLYINAGSMTDENFRLVLSFPRRWRNAYASALAHGNLAFYQMQILNHYPASYEAFAWLFDHICHFECFTAEDMKKTLLDNPDVTSYGIQVCIDSVREKYGDSDKLTAAVNWIQNKK